MLLLQPASAPSAPALAPVPQQPVGVTTGLDAAGLEQRRSVMDERIVRLERDIAANGRELTRAPGELVSEETVFYTVVPCALGFVLVAMTSRGVHRVVLGDDPIVLEAALRDALPAAQVVRDDAALGDMSA
ncbi:MAG: hypothetical protein RJA21_1151, partial [Gemmatimonadota bacterium]